jgi:hypothetical protein
MSFSNDFKCLEKLRKTIDSLDTKGGEITSKSSPESKGLRAGASVDGSCCTKSGVSPRWSTDCLGLSLQAAFHCGLG